MISREDIQRLIHRKPNGRPVLSVFLDMSVNSDNKRTYKVFLNKRRTEYQELEREGHDPDAVTAAFDRMERWIEEEYEESNKGVALYAEVGGDWFDALQFPVPVRNRAAVEDSPMIGPLAQIIESYHHHGVLLIDREHLRLMSVYLGTSVHEHEVRGEPYPAPHDIQRGGYSARDFQQRKAEEVRHFFKEFAKEAAEFDRRYAPDDVVVLGTDENVKKFIEFLPAKIQDKIAYTGHAVVDGSTAEILERLTPYFDDQVATEASEASNVLHERVREQHMATSGFHSTLEQLQEGKVDTLVVARDSERDGSRCTQCGFYLDRRQGNCPYCGGEARDGVDLVEAMIRIAEEQDVAIEFVSPEAVADLNGVGALLRF